MYCVIHSMFVLMNSIYEPCVVCGLVHGERSKQMVYLKLCML